MKVKIKLEIVGGLPYEKGAKKIIDNKTSCEGCDRIIYRKPIKDMNFCRVCVKDYYEEVYKKKVNDALSKI